MSNKYGGRKCHGRTTVNIQSVQNDVTGSRTYVVVSYSDGSKFRFLVDCGMYQGSEEEDARNGKLEEFKPEELDAVLLTHAHVDHCGQIPLLYKEGANCKVYMTEDTRKIVPVLLENACMIIAGSKNPFYNRLDVDKAIHHFEVVEYEKWIELNNRMNVPSGVFIKLVRNEHIPGAAIILVEVKPRYEKSFRMLFSGDYNVANAFSSNRTHLSKEDREADYAFAMVESTYGRKSKENTEVGKFEKDIQKYIADGKSMVITAFANTRFQNVLLRLKRMQENARLSEEIPIYIDGGMGKALTGIWPNLETVDIVDFKPHNLHEAGKSKRELIESNQQFILITTSGMGNYGPARDYLPMVIEKSNFVIYFTGYAAIDSTARKIMTTNIGDKLFINERLKTKVAISDYCEDMSSHARYQDLIAFVSELSNIDLLVWNHGSEAAKIAMKELSGNLKNVNNVAILDGKTAFKIGCSGFERQYSMDSIPRIRAMTLKEKREAKRNEQISRKANNPRKHRVYKKNHAVVF